MTIKAWAEITIAHIIDPPTIVGTVTRYQISDDSVIVPGGLWYTEKPDVPDGSYLWIYTNAVYSDGTQLETHSVSKVGLNGDPTYTWVKYADTETGSGMSDFPEGKRYVGMAFNKTTATGSNVAADYSWSPLYDNVQVGGRNLVPNTNKGIEGWSYSHPGEWGATLSEVTALGVSACRIKVTTKGNTSWHPYLSRSINRALIKNDAVYTLSCDIYSTIDTSITAFLQTSSGTEVLCTFASVLIPANTWVRYVQTATSSTNTTTSQRLYLSSSALRTVDAETTIANIQLEEGNIATDWTPAPEDVQSQIDNVVTRVVEAETQITQTKEMISFKADKTVTDGLTTRVSNAESKITADAITQTVRSNAAYINDLAGKANASSLANYSTLTQTAESIRAEVGKVQVGGANILRNSALQSGDFTDWDARSPGWQVLTTATHPDEMMGYNFLFCGNPSEGQDIWAKEYLAAPGDYTLSLALKGAVTALLIGVRSDGEWASYQEHFFFTSTWDVKRQSTTFTLPDNAVKVRIIFRQSAGYSSVISLIKLETGNLATAWSPHPEEFFAGSSVEINRARVKIATPEFVVAIPRVVWGAVTEQTAMNIDEGGVVADTIVSPSVARAYAGTTWLTINANGGGSYRSIKEAFNAIRGRYLPNDVYIILTAGQTLYEGDIVLDAIYGLGNVYISGNNAKVVGRIRMSNCQTIISSDSFTLVNPDSSDYAIRIANCNYVNLSNVTIDANMASTAIMVSHGGCVNLNTVALYKAFHLLWAEPTSTVSANILKGDGTYSLVTVGGTLRCSGTRPGGMLSAQQNGQLWIDGTTIDYGTAQPPVTPVSTYSYTATDAAFYRSNWTDSSKRLRQGFADGFEHVAGMWFALSTLRSQLNGKTVQSASLAITRQKGFGRSSGIDLHLYGLTNSGPSGAPGRTQDYGIIGSLAQGERKSFGLPTIAATHLANGTVSGLALYAGDGKVMSGKDYSENYGYFYGATEDPVVLTVTA